MSAEEELLRRVRDALAKADLDVDGLVEDAWRDARDEVAGVLRRAFRHELLQRAAGIVDHGTTPARASVPEERTAGDAAPQEPAAQGPAAQEPAPREPAGTEPSPRTAVIVFGITRPTVDLADDTLPRLPGAGPLRAVDDAGLRAVVCDAGPGTLSALETLGTDDLDVLATIAHAHDAILAGIAAQGPVLPLRMGTAVGDESDVRRMLTTSADQLTAELARVDGHAEWAVIVRRHGADPTGAPSDPSAPAASATGSPDGGAYLRQRGAELAARADRQARRQGLADDVHERLRALAVDSDVVTRRPLEQVPPVFHGVYLLRWDAIDDFEACVEDLRRAHPDAIIESTGPWPPYHFTAVELGGA